QPVDRPHARGAATQVAATENRPDRPHRPRRREAVKQPEDAIRDLVRRAYQADPEPGHFDLEAGLAEVHAQVRHSTWETAPGQATSKVIAIPRSRFGSRIAEVAEPGDRMTAAAVAAKLVPADPWDGLTGAELHAACLHAAKAGNRAAMDRLVTELTPLVWHV